jgi:hypothetical protein
MEMAFKYLKDAEVVDGATTGKVMCAVRQVHFSKFKHQNIKPVGRRLSLLN